MSKPIINMSVPNEWNFVISIILDQLDKNIESVPVFFKNINDCVLCDCVSVDDYDKFENEGYVLIEEFCPDPADRKTKSILSTIRKFIRNNYDERFNIQTTFGYNFLAPLNAYYANARPEVKTIYESFKFCIIFCVKQNLDRFLSFEQINYALHQIVILNCKNKLMDVLSKNYIIKFKDNEFVNLV